MSIESMKPSNHLTFCYPLIHQPSIFPSIRVFSNESVLYIKWPKYWSFSFRISPSNEYAGLINLGLTGLISLQSKGLSRVFSNTTSKASILQCSVFFIVQLSHWYMTTGKTIALTRWTFVSKVKSGHSFSSKEQASFNFMTAVTNCSVFWVQENKVCHCFHVSPFICHEVMGPDAMILVFWMLSFKPTFSLSSFTFIKRLFSSLLSAMNDVMCIAEVIDISANSLDSSLCFIQPGISHDVLCVYKLNKQGDNIQPWSTPFLIWSQLVVPCLALTVASWPAYRFLRR